MSRTIIAALVVLGLALVGPSVSTAGYFCPPGPPECQVEFSAPNKAPFTISAKEAEHVQRLESSTTWAPTAIGELETWILTLQTSLAEARQWLPREEAREAAFFQNPGGGTTTGISSNSLQRAIANHEAEIAWFEMILVERKQEWLRYQQQAAEKQRAFAKKHRHHRHKHHSSHVNCTSEYAHRGLGKFCAPQCQC